MEEELFFKKLYLWLTGDRSKPWGWPENTKKSLNIVLTLIYTGNVASKKQKWLIRKDNLAIALYESYIKFPNNDRRLFEIADNNVVPTIKTGFCCLLIAYFKLHYCSEYFERAIKTPFGFARNEYGLYLQKRGLYDPMVFTLFKEAAEQFNDSDGWNNLGWCYQKGIKTKPDHKSAFDCYKKSAKQGNINGIGNLAYCYKEEIGTYVSYQKAIKWYSKSKTYEEKVTELLQLQLEKHPKYIGLLGGIPLYSTYQTFQDIANCDCIQCRCITFERKNPPNRKWFQRWKLCESQCITTILCFHHLFFGGKRIGVLIAKILWKDRDEKQIKLG